MTYYELTSIYGHDTFLLDINNVGVAVKVSSCNELEVWFRECHEKKLCTKYCVYGKCKVQFRSFLFPSYRFPLGETDCNT